MLEMFFYLIVGGLGYGGLELLWRGQTHWTMLLLGGVCFLLIALYSTRFHESLPQTWLLSAVTVTTLEFVCGCIINLRLRWNVWDYADLPCNLFGQVCLPFFGLWFLLSVPCSFLARTLHRILQAHHKHPRETE